MAVLCWMWKLDLVVSVVEALCLMLASWCVLDVLQEVLVLLLVCTRCARCGLRRACTAPSATVGGTRGEWLWNSGHQSESCGACSDDVDVEVVACTRCVPRSARMAPSANAWGSWNEWLCHTESAKDCDVLSIGVVSCGARSESVVLDVDVVDSWYVLDVDVVSGELDSCWLRTRPDLAWLSARTLSTGSVSSHVKGEPEGVDSCGKMLEVDCNGAR
eukprot:1685329-Amphidinium_carterae.1